MAVKHTKVVVTADDGTSEVGSDEWNDDHVIEANTITNNELNSETYSKITGIGVQAQALNMNSNKVENAANPTVDQDLATKAYVDNSINGIKWKEPVRVATTVNGTLSSAYENGDSIDGVALVTGDRILIKDQSSGAENGVYTVNVTGAPTRAVDYDENSEIAQSAVFVREGTVNADQGYVLTNDGSIIVGTTSLAYVLFTGLGQVTAGAGLTKTANQLDVDSTVIRTTGAQTLDSKSNTSHVRTEHDITTTTVALDLSSNEFQTISISADTTFTTSNRASGRSKTVRIITDSTLRTLAFPAWVFVGVEPINQSASKTGILTITAFGTNDTDIVAAYAVEQ